jgi:hypothetical protein
MTIAEHNRLHKKGRAWGHALNCQRRQEVMPSECDLPVAS